MPDLPAYRWRPVSALPRTLLPDTATVAADGALVIGGCRVDEIAAVHGTPVFVYDEAHLRARCREAIDAFGHQRAAYATKAFLCRAMARLAYEEGMLLDVASGGELHVALAAGVPAGACTMHGNNKSDAELRLALEAGVRHIVIDSFDELDRLEALHAGGAASRCPTCCCASRRASTPTPTSTSPRGRTTRSSGSTSPTATPAGRPARAAGSSAVNLVGLHCHIGSNVFAAESFGRAAEVMAAFAAPFDLPELVLGGGLGVAYLEGEEAPTITEWAKVVLDACAAAGVRSTISVEPGRAIVAAAAVTVYTVGTIKPIPGVRTYIAVDGGMSDNPRPVLYGSGYESFLPRAVDADRIDERPHRRQALRVR